MYCGELRDKGIEYSSGHSKGIDRAFCEAREYICKYMYKHKKKKLSMFEICDLLRRCETEYSHFCDTFGHGLGYDYSDQDDDPEDNPPNILPFSE